MQSKLVEQLTLIASVIKWSIYAAIVGILVGTGTTVFLKALAWTSGMAGGYPPFKLSGQPSDPPAAYLMKSIAC